MSVILQPPQQSFKHALLRTLLLPILLGVALSALFFTQIRHLTHLAKRVEHTDKVIATAHEAGYFFMEARIRWYRDVAGRTPSPAMISDMREDMLRIRQRIDEMEWLVRDNAPQAEHARRMRSAIERWTETHSAFEGNAQRPNASVVTMLSVADPDAREFRQLLDRFIGAEERLRDERQMLSDNTHGFAVATGIVILLVLGVVIGFSTRYQILRLGEAYDDALTAVAVQARTLESANHAKNLFLANMSHEMRTPLAAILGFANVARTPNQSAGEIQNALQIIHRNAQQLHKLVHDLLDIARIEAGHLQIAKAHVVVPDLVNEVRVNFKKPFLDKGIEMKITYARNMPEAIFTDPARLSQILTNLVANALKFTAKGEVKIEGLVEPPSEVRSGKIVFRVSDTGIGIASQDTARLFHPFVQVDSSETRAYSGTGLGLAISRELARALGGDLILERSRPNEGSVFRLSLPLEGATRHSVASSDEARSPEAPAVGSLRPLRGRHILVVEDSPDLQALIMRILTSAGADVAVASNGSEALRTSADSNFDAVLMDIQMPGMDGLTTTRRLRERGWDGPIIALTAHASEEERQRCLEAGCDDHVAKPMDADSLVWKIAQMAPEAHSL